MIPHGARFCYEISDWIARNKAAFSIERTPGISSFDSLFYLCMQSPNIHTCHGRAFRYHSFTSNLARSLADSARASHDPSAAIRGQSASNKDYEAERNMLVELSNILNRYRACLELREIFDEHYMCWEVAETLASGEVRRYCYPTDSLDSEHFEIMARHITNSYRDKAE
jgi:hypothetical protein